MQVNKAFDIQIISTYKHIHFSTCNWLMQWIKEFPISLEAQKRFNSKALIIKLYFFSHCRTTQINKAHMYSEAPHQTTY